MDRRTRRALLDRLTRDADRICHAFGLRYRVLEAERANVKRRYGICYSDGTIKIRLRHVTTGEPLKYSSLVNTLCHELAHLRHFNHGPHFQAFYQRLLRWSRDQGIYRPAPIGRRLVPVEVAGRMHPQVAARASVRPTPPPKRKPNAAREPEGPQQLSLF